MKLKRIKNNPLPVTSYVAVSKATGIGVWEFYNPAIIAKINHEKYAVLTAHAYLAGLNAR